MPSTKNVRFVINPSVTVVAPSAVSSGHRLGRALLRAAAEDSNASGSIAETLESRTKTLIAASSASPTAAEISPIVPSEPSWVTP